MLSINPSELIWTIIGFFALYFLLSRFLFRPLVSFMDERRARIDAGLNEEKQAQDALKEDTERLERCREDELLAARQQLRTEKDRDERRRVEALAQAREAAGLLRGQGQREADALRENTEREVALRGDELAERLAERLLNTGNTEQ